MQSFSLSSDHDDITELLKSYKSKSEEDWMKEGQAMAGSLYKSMKDRVPAYKKHISKHPLKIDTKPTTDIVAATPIDKDNYLRTYPRQDLCWDGQFKGNAWVISATSGSSGIPYYFPRQQEQDKYYAITAEAYLKEFFLIHEKTTLYINAFPMGIWIGGVFTYEAIKQVAEKGYPLSIITPGINKLEVIKALQNLGADFDQVIIGSYAPFLKDIIDDGEKQGLDWMSLNLKFIFSAEAFSEEFRDYLQKKTGLKNIYKDTLNHYGTVDLGTMAHETPISILLRRLALKNPDLYADLFDRATKLPTFAQYDPTMFYFEEVDGNLFCSAYSGLPLYRYDLKDRGGIVTKRRIDELCKRYDVNLSEEIKKAGISDTIWNLPFVFVFERNDFSVSFFAFQIYPETVRKALLQQYLPEKVTGKCAMQVLYDKAGTQKLIINIELMSGIEQSEELSANIAETITQRLLSENSEYRKTSEELGTDRVRPIIRLWDYGDETYFRPGGKQKWTIKA